MIVTFFLVGAVVLLPRDPVRAHLRGGDRRAEPGDRCHRGRLRRLLLPSTATSRPGSTSPSRPCWPRTGPARTSAWLRRWPWAAGALDLAGRSPPLGSAGGGLVGPGVRGCGRGGGGLAAVSLVAVTQLTSHFRRPRRPRRGGHRPGSWRPRAQAGRAARGGQQRQLLRCGPRRRSRCPGPSWNSSPAARRRRPGRPWSRRPGQPTSPRRPAGRTPRPDGTSPPAARPGGWVAWRK